MAWNWKSLFTRKSSELPADPALPHAPAQIEQQSKPKVTWALNADEASFNPDASVVSFRTLGFRNLAHPDSPIEYLEADYIPDVKRWCLRQCSVGDGRALSVMFNRDVAGSTLPMPTQKSVTLVDRAAFMLVLQKMAVYEFGTDTASQYAMREVVEEDITSSYFMNIAHAAGVVFDVNGHPSMTRNGRPMRDGQYPESELDHAVAYDNAHKSIPLAALLGSAPLAQEKAGLDNFDDFSRLLKFNQKLDSIMGELKDLRTRFFIEEYDRGNFTCTYSDAKWTDLKPDLIHGRFNYISAKINEAADLLRADDVHKDAVNYLNDINVMIQVAQSAAVMQCYHNKDGNRVPKDFVKLETITAALASADAVLESCESFSDERKKMIRGFIMNRHSVEESLMMFDSIVANVGLLIDASKNAEKAALQQSQVKIEAVPSYYEIPVQENPVSLEFIQEKFPKSSSASILWDGYAVPEAPAKIRPPQP